MKISLQGIERPVNRPVAWYAVCALLLQLFVSHGVFAQERSVQGKITASEDGTPMPGVSVLIKGTTSGSATDANGSYQINVPSDNATLVFSFIGFATQEIAIGNRTTLNVNLSVDTKQLSEVVVTALGIQKDKRTLGYTVQEVKGADLIKAREPNPINSLVGKIAGLTVGSSPELLGRPQLVLRGNTDILFVVDGVPVNSDTWNVSADDIDTYTVLKGPNASALYGSRGINGAILITTKRGTKDKRGFSVEFNSSTMFDKGFLAIPKVQDEYGPGEYYKYAFGDGSLGEGGVNNGDYDIWGPKFEGQLIPQYDSPINPTTGHRTGTPWVARGKDNLKRFVQTGILSTNNVAISSSNDKYDLRVSVSNSYQRGIIPNTKLSITNFNVSTGYNFSSKLRFESNINFNKQYTPNYPDVQYGPNSLIYNIDVWGGADWNIDDMKNYWQPGKEGIQQIYAEYVKYNNPYFVANEWLRGHHKTDIYGYAKMRYKLTNFLDISLRTQVTTWDLTRTEKMPYSAISYDRYQKQGDYREDRRSLFENNTDILVNFDKEVMAGLHVNASVGGNLRTFTYNSSFASTDYLNVPGVYNFSNSKNPVKLSNYGADMQVGSGYYTVDLSYKGFLNFSTTGRVDKLSTLPKNNNTYFYPSVALSTVISDYVKIPGPISFLKIRGSYANVKDGLTQSTIGPSGYPISYGTAYQSSYDGPSYANGAYYGISKPYNNTPAAYYTNTINNPALKPSSVSSYETGLDVRFLQNRLSLDLTYFNNLNGPKIFNLPISETSGYTTAIQNGIKTQKQGWEVSLTGSALKNPNGLNWDVTANWSTYKETLKEIYPGVDALNIYYKAGDRLDKVYGSKFFRSPDGQIINDNSGLPLQDGARPQFLGYANPKWVWGLNNRFSYKNITFSFQFDGRVGGVIADYIQLKTYQGGRNQETVEGDYGKARLAEYQNVNNPNYAGGYVGPGVVITGGTPTYDLNGNITNLSSLEFATNTKATFLQDYIGKQRDFTESSMISRTYAKLREIVIGYSIPNSILAKSFIKRASISLVGRNLVYFAKHRDLDVDQYPSGYNFSNSGLTTSSGLQTPSTRRYGFNINLVF